ncbi:MAG: hypothetical protein ACQES2_01350 [Pseudomonadota bacterium]
MTFTREGRDLEIQFLDQTVVVDSWFSFWPRRIEELVVGGMTYSPSDINARIQ